MRKTRFVAIAIAVLTAALALAACGDDEKDNRGFPQTDEAVDLDPADFTLDIDNPYWPMRPGSRWTYRETDSTGAVQKVVITVTDKTKKVGNGITARVIHDVATADGKPVEITDDYYAQDNDGNLWYLGENTAEYDEQGKVESRLGSWEAGVSGAQPGIAMPADPEPGLSYRQEYRKGQAEDRAEIVAVGDDKVEVPAGFFNKDIVMTRDVTPVEPKVQELKFYAPNIGPVLTFHTDGLGGRGALVSYKAGGG